MNPISLFIRNLRQQFSLDLDQVTHALGERHDRTEARLDLAEPRLDASELRLDGVEARADEAEKRVDTAIDKADLLEQELTRIRQLIEQRIDEFEQRIDVRLEEYQVVIDKRVDERFTTFEKLSDGRLGSMEIRLDLVETKIDERLATLTQSVNQRAAELELSLDERLVDFDVAVDERMTNYETAVDERMTSYETAVDNRFEQYSAAIDERVDERSQQVEIRNDEQAALLAASINQSFEQRTRALDVRADDRFSQLDRNLDQRVSAFEKGIDNRLFAREKFVDDRLVVIRDDIVARTDLLLQHSEQRMDQLRRAMRIVLETNDNSGADVNLRLQKFDQLKKSRGALEDISARVTQQIGERPEQAKAIYHEILDWKKEAVESLKKFSPDEQEVVDYIMSYVDHSDPKHESYVQTHMRRFVETLNRIPPPQKSTAKLLELGSCFFFTPAINKFCGYHDISCADWSEGAKPGVEQRVVKQLVGSETHTFETRTFNAERDQFPYPDNSFQIVLSCEMLEHLSRDPMHMFWECNRILEQDGLLLLSTPNIVSARSLEAQLTSYPPYLWLQYNLKDAAQQHYHEHAPETIQTFLAASGFSIVELETADVWAKSNPAIIELLKKLEFSPRLRGDNIFVLARKTGVPTERYPATMYVQAEPEPKKIETPKQEMNSNTSSGKKRK